MKKFNMWLFHCPIIGMIYIIKYAWEFGWPENIDSALAGMYHGVLFVLSTLVIFTFLNIPI